jgi:hypothetical protein
MSDTIPPAAPAHAGVSARYGDAKALNDIHALLTRLGALAAEKVTASVAGIVARTGRPLTRFRMITAEVTEDWHGLPVARAGTDGTRIRVSQDPNGTGILIQALTRDPAEASALVITVNGKPAVCPPDLARAEPGRARP